MISVRLIESACRVPITHDRSFAARINRQISFYPFFLFLQMKSSKGIKNGERVISQIRFSRGESAKFCDWMERGGRGEKREGKSVGGSFFFRAAEYRLPKIPVITDRRGLVRDGSKSPWRKTAHGPQ